MKLWLCNCKATGHGPTISFVLVSFDQMFIGKMQGAIYQISNTSAAVNFNPFARLILMVSDKGEKSRVKVS